MKTVLKLCAVILIAAALTLSVCAEKSDSAELIYSFAERLYEGEFDGFSLPEDAEFYSVEDEENKDGAADGKDGEKTEEDTGLNKRVTSSDGKVSFITEGEEEYVKVQMAQGKSEVSVEFSLSGMKCTSGTGCLGFAFHLNGEAVAGAATPYVNVTVRMFTENREYVCEVPVASGGSGRLFADVSGIDCDSFERMTVTFSATDGVSNVTDMILTGPYVSEEYDFIW